MAINSNQNINIWLTQITEQFRTAVSVDCVIFGYDEKSLKILLSRCDMPPYEHELSLLGDIVHPNETTDEAALRVLRAKTGLNDVFMDQVQVFSDLNRHPLARVITVAYYSLVKIDDNHLAHLSQDDYIQWVDVAKIKSLAFDHLKIMNTCLEKLRKEIRKQPIGFNLLPQKFSLHELQTLYEVVLDIQLDKRNFRRKLKNYGFLKDIGKIQEEVSHRPAKLYTFDEEAYKLQKKKGFLFDI
jgi:8-oxo-dGTP diphosphatase